jgi:hypothetical protein
MLPEFTADSVTAISPTALYKLGYKVVTKDVNGTKFWRYVKNAAGSSLKVGQGTMIKDGSTTWDADVSTTAASHARFLGVAQAYTLNGTTSLFLDTYFGFVQCEGYGKVLGIAAGVAANSSLKCVAAGEFDAGTIGTNDLVAFNPAALAAGTVAGSAYIKSV